MNKAKEITKKTLKISGNVIFALCLVLALVVTFVSLGSSTDNTVPGIFGYSPMAVKTESMKPVINKGDLIFVNKKITEFEEGDIITFYTMIDGVEALNTHEIITVVPGNGTTIEESYVTKGANNPGTDTSEVMKSKVVGKYTGTRIPLVGHVVNFASTSVGFFVMIIIPLLGYFVYHVVKVVLVAVEYKKKKEEVTV